MRDGIWGAIAAGVVFDSMRHVSGRRPPHAAERSRELLARFREQGLRAELLANLAGCVAALDHPSESQILRLAATWLAVLPDADVDPAAIAAAAMALQVEAARWARLRVGEQLSYEWPSPPAARTGRARPPRIVRPDKKRKGGWRAAGLRRPARDIGCPPGTAAPHRALLAAGHRRGCALGLVR
jgi:hypothetical protein